MNIRVGDVVKNAMTTRTGVVLEVITDTLNGPPVSVVVSPLEQEGLGRRVGDKGWNQASETWSAMSIYVIS